MRLLIGLLVTVGTLAGVAAGGAGGAAVSACRPGDLAASVYFQGATGHLLGGFVVRNRSSRTCAIGGRPRLALFRADGRRVALVVLPADERLPTVRPQRVLAPRASAQAWILWERYCGSLAQRPFRFRATLTTGTRLSASTPARVGIKCESPGAARLLLSAFEPAR